MSTHRSPKDTLYGYFPSMGAAITFLTFYGISTTTHLVQAIYYRAWWLTYTVVAAGLIEATGWSGRLLSSIDPFSKAGFQIQICCTIMAPTHLLAANFIILSRIINYLGPQYSRISPLVYTIVFCICDVTSLVVQGVGGGIAASAADLAGANQGARIMLGGIVFQLIVMVVSSICFADYFIRYYKDDPYLRHGHGQTRRGITRKQSRMLWAVGLVTILLFIRSIYRTIELADGWAGRIIRTETYFIVLDGVMVTAAIFTYNFFHPCALLPPTPVTLQDGTVSRNDSRNDDEKKYGVF